MPNSGGEKVFHLEASREPTQSLGGTFRRNKQKFCEKIVDANRRDWKASQEVCQTCRMRERWGRPHQHIQMRAGWCWGAVSR